MISGCEKIWQVDSQKRVTKDDNRKRMGFVKWYMLTPTAVTVSLAVDSQKKIGPSRVYNALWQEAEVPSLALRMNVAQRD